MCFAGSLFNERSAHERVTTMTTSEGAFSDKE